MLTVPRSADDSGSRCCGHLVIVADRDRCRQRPKLQRRPVDQNGTSYSSTPLTVPAGLPGVTPNRYPTS